MRQCLQTKTTFSELLSTRKALNLRLNQLIFLSAVLERVYYSWYRILSKNVWYDENRAKVKQNSKIKNVEADVNKRLISLL